MEITVDPIGVVRSTRAQVRDDDWDKEQALIELDSESFSAEALFELDQFSRVEIIYLLHQVPESSTFPVWMQSTGPRYLI